MNSQLAVTLALLTILAAIFLSLLAEDEDQVIRLVARRPRLETEEALDKADRELRCVHNLSEQERVYFFEVERGDASTFADTLKVTGRPGDLGQCGLLAIGQA